MTEQKRKFIKSKIVKTKSSFLSKTGDISKQLTAEKDLLIGRIAEIDTTLALLKEHPELEKIVENVIKPLEVKE